MPVAMEKKPAIKTTSDTDLKNALTHLKNKDKIVQQAFDLFRREFPDYNIMGIYSQLAEKTGFSIMTIRRIISGVKTPKTRCTPEKRRIVQNEHA